MLRPLESVLYYEYIKENTREETKRSRTNRVDRQHCSPKSLNTAVGTIWLLHSPSVCPYESGAGGKICCSIISI